MLDTFTFSVHEVVKLQWSWPVVELSDGIFSIHSIKLHMLSLLYT